MRFLRATRRGHAWLYDPANVEGAVAALVERSGSEEGLARQSYQVLVQERRLITPDATISHEGVTNVIALMVEQGRLPAPAPPADKYLAPRYIERAAAAP